MIRTASLYSFFGTADLLDLLQKLRAEGLTKDSTYTKYGMAQFVHVESRRKPCSN
jgi:hypothetical protein